MFSEAKSVGIPLVKGLPFVMRIDSPVVVTGLWRVSSVLPPLRPTKPCLWISPYTGFPCSLRWIPHRLGRLSLDLGGIILFKDIRPPRRSSSCYEQLLPFPPSSFDGFNGTKTAPPAMDLQFHPQLGWFSRTDAIKHYLTPYEYFHKWQKGRLPTKDVMTLQAWVINMYLYPDSSSSRSKESENWNLEPNVTKWS